MTDLFVKLLPLKPPATNVGDPPVTIRRALSPERYPLVQWVRRTFGDAWAGECETGFSTTPSRSFIAVRGQEILGFACWDVTALGFFGPTGVAEEARGLGIGAALLRNTLWAMRSHGYVYGFIGGVGPIPFYEKLVGAVEIPGSTPGLYEGMIIADGPPLTPPAAP